MGAEKLVLFVLAPIAVVILVLGWFYLIQRGRRSATLQLSGLGLSIKVQTVESQVIGDANG